MYEDDKKKKIYKHWASCKNFSKLKNLKYQLFSVVENVMLQYCTLIDVMFFCY